MKNVFILLLLIQTNVYQFSNKIISSTDDIEIYIEELSKLDLEIVDKIDNLYGHQIFMISVIILGFLLIASIAIIYITFNNKKGNIQKIEKQVLNTETLKNEELYSLWEDIFDDKKFNYMSYEVSKNKESNCVLNRKKHHHKEGPKNIFYGKKKSKSR